MPRPQIKENINPCPTVKGIFCEYGGQLSHLSITPIGGIMQFTALSVKDWMKE